MASRLVRLYADNYRTFVNFELRPGRRSLLLGYNGSGKSSVFDVLWALESLVEVNDEVREVFPNHTVTKFGGSNEQRFELDIETERGVLHYVLHLAHDLEKETAAIALEALSLDGVPAYRFANGEVQLYDDRPVIKSFPFGPQRSFLASVDPETPSSPIKEFKDFLSLSWNLRLDPGRIGASAAAEDRVLARDASNFAAWCRAALQETPDLMQRAHEALREIIPGFQHLRLQPAGRAKVLVATFRHPGGKLYELDFDRLSDGQKTLIVLYVVLHSEARHRPVFCLDEPDNFVSIREIQPFLTELADVSDETGLQVLLISHSPEVIDYASTSGAILFERPEGGHTRVRTIEATGPLRLSELMARGWLPGGSDGAG